MLSDSDQVVVARWSTGTARGACLWGGGGCFSSSFRLKPFDFVLAVLHSQLRSKIRSKQSSPHASPPLPCPLRYAPSLTRHEKETPVVYSPSSVGSCQFFFVLTHVIAKQPCLCTLRSVRVVHPQENVPENVSAEIFLAKNISDGSGI
ncbi:unnamed protein product [Laminaria digitata]